MTRLFLDAGTSWSKVLELYSTYDELNNSPLSVVENLPAYLYGEENQVVYDKEGNPFYARMFLFPSKLFSSVKVDFDGATGHMVKERLKEGGSYQNEVISLAYGSKKVIKDLSEATIVDIGSRDLKWVKFIDGKYRDLDWNSSCGSVTGATVEMLCKFYNVDPNKISPQESKIPVTCGVFAMEKIMDNIASDVPADIAIAKYINGIAYNTWVFAKSPGKIYLSGGFSQNKCFIDSLKFYCEVEIMGRFLLLNGLF